MQTVLNPLMFLGRNHLGWGRGTYQEPVEPKSLGDLSHEAQVRVEDLVAGYPHQAFRDIGTAQRYRESLQYLDGLDQLRTAYPTLFPESCESLRWLDIGCKNWSYVPALIAFAEKIASTVAIDGLEIDANRLYTNLYRRRDYATCFINALPQANYFHADLMHWPPVIAAQTACYDVITWFLPFVLPEPHLAWGLPKRLFQPECLLAKALSLLTPEGVMIIVNQGEAEAEAQRQLLLSTFPPCQFIGAGELSASLGLFHYPRYAWLVRQ